MKEPTRSIISCSYPPCKGLPYFRPDMKDSYKLKDSWYNKTHIKAKSKGLYNRKRRGPVKYVICEIVK